MPTTGGALAFERLHAAVRGDADEEPARRRRDHHRQDRPDRAGQLGRRRADADAGQLQRGRRLRLQPVRSAAAIRARRPVDGRPVLQHRRIELRHRHRGELLGRPTSAPRPSGRSSARRTRTCSSASSRRSAASAATASSRSPPIRTPPGRWRRRSPTPRSCSARSKARRPIRTMRRRRRARRRRTATTRSSCNADGLKGARIGIPRAFYYDRVTLPGENDAARRPQRRAGEGDGRGDRGAEAAGRGRSSIPPTSRASSTRIANEQLPAVGLSARAPNTRRARTRTARSTSSTA